MQEYLSAVKTELPELSIKLQEPMNRHTSFHIGGPADYYAEPTSVEELSALLKILCRYHVTPVILGNGSNVLVSDEGIRGMVIATGMLQGIRIEDDIVSAKAGELLSKTAACARDASLTGMEFAHGIPGSVGGAVYMNAGAYGGEMKLILDSVLAADPAGTLHRMKTEELNLGYRKSIFQQNGWLILEADFRLEQGDKDEISNQMNELIARRKSSQPLEFYSAGSTFKRPEGYYAGTLIDQTGLKGLSFGDAQVAEKHAGFIINRGNASCEDVLSLIREVQKRVYEKFGVMLEPEVRMIPPEMGFKGQGDSE